jgi:hypothetical protein
MIDIFHYTRDVSQFVFHICRDNNMIIFFNDVYTYTLSIDLLIFYEMVMIRPG